MTIKVACDCVRKKNAHKRRVQILLEVTHVPVIVGTTAMEQTMEQVAVVSTLINISMNGGFK